MAEGYKGVEIYCRAHNLAVRAHALSLQLPSFEKYEEAPQLRRSSKRVSASIVEGYAQRKYRDEFLRYLYRALGSSDESREHLEYLLDTGSSKGFEVVDLIQSYAWLSGKIVNYIGGVEARHTTPAWIARAQQSTINNPQSNSRLR